MVEYTNIDIPRLKLEQEIRGGYDQNIYTFDIETSSGYLWPGKDTVEPFDYKKSRWSIGTLSRSGCAMNGNSE